MTYKVIITIIIYEKKSNVIIFINQYDSLQIRFYQVCFSDALTYNFLQRNN